ncbi:hypothetical protein U0534_04140 [Bacillus atrophaeus]|nr:hypothetical protein [Bacillus atrophaeus]MEC1728387.1 hypothetical protein [Bacillus atrophaeus]WQP45293.1 hypothetical protein U0534_04140 [Bacillus atrophaeus]
MSWRQSQYSGWVIVEAEQGQAIYDPMIMPNGQNIYGWFACS